jgi:hypothetical protein
VAGRIAALVALSALVAGAGVALAAHRVIPRQRARAVAASINLRHGDLPSYAQQPNPTTAPEKRINAQLAKCIGTTPDSAALADVQSQSFVSPGTVSIDVGSTAEIQRSAATVASDLRAITAPRALRCFESELSTQLRASIGSKGTLLSLTGKSVPSVVRGSDGTFAFRFTFVTAVNQGKQTVNVPAYADFVGFGWGQAEVSLSIETELAPPPAALERQLAARLVSRARAAIG